MVNTLRRKMFKLGGSASSHGVGLTSGLSFNQGGSVKPGPDGKPRLHAKTGLLVDLLTGGASNIYRRGRGVIDAIRKARAPEIPAATVARGAAGPTRAAIPAGPGVTRALFDALRTRPVRSLTTAGILGAPAVGLLTRGKDMTEPSENVGDMISKVGTEIARAPITFTAGAPFYGKDILEAESFEDALNALLGEGEAYEKFYETTFGSKPPEFGFVGREETPLEEDDAIKPGITRDELMARADAQQRADLEAAMAMYQDLIRGEDNTNKLMTLGDAAIAAGSSLMEGEGYGRAAAAFNEPLTQARAAQQERDATTRAAAAQLAIGEDIASRQADRARSDQLLATGDFDTEEEINAVLLARQFGITQRIPEDDKGEVAEDIRDKPGVYVDAKQRFGTLFVAINSKGEDLKTNDPELAKQHAED